jgi:hypothetical protein
MNKSNGTQSFIDIVNLQIEKGEKYLKSFDGSHSTIQVQQMKNLVNHMSVKIIAFKLYFKLTNDKNENNKRFFMKKQIDTLLDILRVGFDAEYYRKINDFEALLIEIEFIMNGEKQTHWSIDTQPYSGMVEELYIYLYDL